MHASAEFTTAARQLRYKGQQLRQLHQIYKAGGLGVLGLSALALVGTAGATIPLAIGGLIYGAAVLSEQQRTGKLLPLPWADDDLGEIAAKSLQSDATETLGIQRHHYLSTEEKVLYFLSNYCAPQLTALAEQYEDHIFDHVIDNLVDRLASTRKEAMNHPELIAQALGADFLEEALDALPPAKESAQSIIEKHRQQPRIKDAVTVDAEPVEMTETHRTPDYSPEPVQRISYPNQPEFTELNPWEAETQKLIEIADQQDKAMQQECLRVGIPVSEYIAYRADTVMKALPVLTPSEYAAVTYPMQPAKPPGFASGFGGGGEVVSPGGEGAVLPSGEAVVVRQFMEDVEESCPQIGKTRDELYHPTGAPKRGHAYYVIKQAAQYGAAMGCSQNWLIEKVFKISKGSIPYQWLRDVYNGDL